MESSFLACRELDFLMYPPCRQLTMLRPRLMAPEFLAKRADTAAIAASKYVIISDMADPSSSHPLKSARTVTALAQVLFCSLASFLSIKTRAKLTEPVLRKQLTLVVACMISPIPTAVVVIQEMNRRSTRLGPLKIGSWSPPCLLEPFEANKVMMVAKLKLWMQHLRGALARIIISRIECILRIQGVEPSDSTASLSLSKISMLMVT